uniref:CSON012374 protein n=1 Tax=Culicoides sonorensis TaxID=179676 RepID=A0A336M5B2_CULSO
MPVVASMNPSNTDASVQRTDSQRSQSNGPRVSFNKDVHVKKIGRRLSDPLEVSFHPNIRRELPSDLSDKALRREAALVLSQADAVKKGQHITLARTSSDPKRRKEDKSNRFGSLPTRGKPLGRSASDASSKKSKRPSIFNFFALKKNEYNIDEEEKKTETNNNNSVVNNNKKVTRSKSDVGSGGITRHDFRRSPRRKHDDTEELSMLKKNPQLSPIIEDTNRDDYFEDKKDQTDSDKQRQSNSRTPESKTFFGQETNSFTSSHPKKVEEPKQQSDQENKDSSRPVNLSENLGPSFTETLENMHSSQLPPEKPPLTKGMKVPRMVKRLSMEKLSPPPPGVKAFSYLSPRTSPNADDEDRKIVYAEVICTKDEKDKRDQFRSNQFEKKPVEEFKNDEIDELDYYRNAHTRYDNKPYTNGFAKHYDDDDFDLTPNKLTPAERFAAKYKTAISYSTENLLKSQMDEEDVEIIKPSIRDLPPEKPPINSWELGRRGQADGKEYYPEFNELSNRREELYSRIKSRINSNNVRETVTSSQQVTTTTNGFTSTYNPNQIQVRRNLSKEFLNADTDDVDYNKNIRGKYSLTETNKNSLNGNAFKSHVETHQSEIKSNKYAFDDSNDDSSQINKYIVTKSPLREPSPKREIFDSRHTRNHTTNISVNASDVSAKTRYKSQEKEQKTNFTNSLGRKKKQNTILNGKSLPLSPEKLIHVTEKFLKKERRHTDESTRSQYLHRERSIDDGSRFDPRIDKYNTTERKNRSQTVEDHKVDKRFGSLGRMKQILMGNGNNNNNNKKSKKNNENIVPNSQEIFVSDDEMRSRYREYRGQSGGYERENVVEVQEIANRRRLSTPRSSPVVHRELIRKESDEPKQQIKTSWFKSLDRLSRKKNASKENLDTVQRDRSASPFKRSKSPGKPKLRFFGDSDVESSISKGKTTERVRKSTPFTLTKSNKVYSKSAFNLNSTGSNDSKERKSDDHSSRSASLYDLDKTVDRKMRQRERVSRSRELHNISEDISTSENEHSTFKGPKYGSDFKLKQRRGNSSSSERAVPLKTDYNRTRQHHSVDSYDEDNGRHMSSDRRTSSRDVSRERQSMSPLRYSYEHELAPKGSGDYRKPPLGPPKPARNFMRQKEIERIQDSSGTEGELSQHSVVYLHATTVGDIPPQTYIPPSRSTSKSASRSRDDLSNGTDRTDGKIEPMTKTVSRSISMLAPWRPKHMSEGYEIDYSKRQTRKYVVPSQNSTSTLPKPQKSNGLFSSKDKPSGRTMSSSPKKYSTVDRKYRAQDEFEPTYRSGYDLDRYRSSPVGGYNHSKYHFMVSIYV